MTERAAIGEILVGAGRLGESDIEKALEYQRANGGYFGEALQACGLVSEGEVEWGLASQFDLPYVFPEADAIDYDAASLVSPEWALAHLALPIMKTEESLTVIVASPSATDAVEELRALTDLKVDLALAAASKIRELIRQVYARATAADEEVNLTPIGLTELLGHALEVAAPRFGVSVRGVRAWAWWDDSGSVRRRPLAGDWEGTLDRLMEPSPSSVATGSRARWTGDLNRAGIVTSVDVYYLSDESGLEYLFIPGRNKVDEGVSFSTPPEGIVSEVRLLARSGTARFIVTTDPAALGHEILPHLPDMLLDPSWRSIYINAQDQPAAAKAFSHRVPQDPETWAAELETLRAFHFDVVTVDLSGGGGEWAGSALDVASIAFLLWSDEDDFRSAYEAGIRWHMRIASGEDGELEWSLEAVAP